MTNIPSRILCIDREVDSPEKTMPRKWRKDWNSLSPGVPTVSLDEFPKVPINATVLILVHQSVFRDSEEMETGIAEICGSAEEWPVTCVAVVSTGSHDHSIQRSGRLCYLGTSFPQDLSHLRTRVNTLVEELPFAEGDEAKLVKCWEHFESAGRPSEHLISMSILCQGYLAAGALMDGSRSWNATSGIGQALRGMEWATPDADDESSLVASTAVADLKLVKPSALPGIEFWLSPFGEPEGHEWSGVVKELRSKLEKEWREDVPDVVDRLINDIDQTGKNGGSVDMDLVAEAFLAFQERLEKDS